MTIDTEETSAIFLSGGENKNLAAQRQLHLHDFDD